MTTAQLHQARSRLRQQVQILVQAFEADTGYVLDTIVLERSRATRRAECGRQCITLIIVEMNSTGILSAE